MQLLVCGSDNWSMEEYQKLQSLCGKRTRIINSYGLTEATIDSTFFESPSNSLVYFDTNKCVPIGKPFPNTDIFILDENLDVLENGQKGEIYIGGNGLARGYLNNLALTDQRFIFHKKLKKRLYKTGDLGCYLPDGNIEFLGRLDNQIKFRGARIELSDIENALNGHFAIRESIASVLHIKSGQKKLAAYIVPEEGIELNVPEIKKFLRNKLPPYMIPSFFIKREALPVTPNGKLDRQAITKDKP
jgi:acyl-CoA synthetase (AMP-forming)/AMP-acid ligase II